MTTTHEPRRNTVCTDDNGDLMQPHFRRDRRWAWKDHDAWRLIDGGVCVSRGRTLADAVLWVAEGKR